MGLVNLSLILTLITTCVSTRHEVAYYVTSYETIKPGSQVVYAGQKLSLATGSLAVGDYFYAGTKSLHLKDRGHVAVVSIIPAIKTPTCEAQTHLLSEASDLPAEVERIVISADTTKVQKAFAVDTGLINLRYFSDAPSLEFGKKSGLLVAEYNVLTRAVLVTDVRGIIRYLQVVPDINQLPDMEKAFEIAKSLAPK